MIKLIGMLDSPYVRRVAISMKVLGVPFEHLPLSVFRNVEEFQQLNPLVKAPTLVGEEGEVLMDSSLILDYLDSRVEADRRLIPTGALRPSSLRLIGLALVACEKTVQIVYERTLRPPEKQHQPWLDRIQQQLEAAYDELESVAVDRSTDWLLGDRLLQPDITLCVAWCFTQFVIADVIPGDRYPALRHLSDRAEQLPEFITTPLE